MGRAVFCSGSILRHVVTMTAASTVGLVAMFTVDLVDMYFLSLLGEQELVAAVGFGGTLLFFLTAVSIGLQIGMGALVSRAEGAHRRDLAGRYCSNILIFSGIAASVISAVAFIYLEDLLRFLGARGITLDYALAYSRIIIPNTAILAMGMCAANATRAIGDARRSMYATLGGSAVNAILDPILIFGLGWGIEGAAVASNCARFVVLLLAFHAIFRVHNLPRPTSIALIKGDFRAISAVAGPAMLTNLATPIGASFVLKSMAQFGDGAVAGAAIMGRITPVAFAAVFALSGAIGPIIGQNAGAHNYTRVRQTLLAALLCNVLYVLAVWVVLWLLADGIVAVFSARDDAEFLIRFYINWLVGAFMFSGVLFVANASFNNLHRAHLATLFNFGRTLLGTIPCVYLGAKWYGAPGVMAGEALGATLFGSLAFAVVLWQVHLLGRKQGSQPVAAPLDDTVGARS
ncbi:MAG: MATE family efflux transporter [Gammaproteobacteria bacterium]|nr:MATE family efflux transporter [Gammaproteobacteria bacterium]